jgi:hypothetical protein
MAIFFTQNKAKLCKNSIITLVFEKKKTHIFLPKFGEIWQNSQKIEIVTSAPAWFQQRQSVDAADVERGADVSVDVHRRRDDEAGAGGGRTRQVEPLPLPGTRSR